jgi:uncharacterized protein YcfJ
MPCNGPREGVPGRFCKTATLQLNEIHIAHLGDRTAIEGGQFIVANFRTKNNRNKRNRKRKNMTKETTEVLHTNRDPITGAPGAHPVGTGIGAAAGGAAAGAAIGTVAGPVGTAVGMAAGAIAGGLAGKSVAEKIDPTVEDTYWRTTYISRSYVDKDSQYDIYQSAYRTGYEGYGRYPGKRYEEVESDLQRDYEKTRRTAGLEWSKAKHATKDAWLRLENRPKQNA